MTRTLLPDPDAPAADYTGMRLPDGFTWAQPQPRIQPAPVQPLPPHDAAASGTLGCIQAACGCTVTLHRSRYDNPVAGGYTTHGYASRCTGCGHLTVGYMPHDGYARARTDARSHKCSRGCSRG